MCGANREKLRMPHRGEYYLLNLCRTSACRRRRTASAALPLPAAPDAWRYAALDATRHSSRHGRYRLLYVIH
jgi:hypothetical protein